MKDVGNGDMNVALGEAINEMSWMASPQMMTGISTALQTACASSMSSPLCAVTVNSVHEYFTGTLIAEAFCKVIGSAGECECAGVRKHRKLACFVLPDVY